MLIAEGVAPERITVIPNGVDLERFSPSDDGVAIRARHSLQDRVVIGHTGTLAVWHGVDHLSCVIRELLPRYRNASLLIVGDGKPLARLSREAELAGVAEQLVLTGRVPHDEMPRYLAAMDIPIAPFTVEAYGAGVPFYGSALKLFEYLAMGKPVVAARIGQITEVIEDGTSGLLYDPADGHDLVEHVSQLIEQPALRQTLGIGARLAVARYSWIETARTVEALARRLLPR
jgi:glycosyltransferase involved in cell wall biosynthesis